MGSYANDWAIGPLTCHDAATSRGFYSTTPYNFLPEQAGALLGTIGYHRADLREAAISIHSTEHWHVQSCLTTSFPSPSREAGCLGLPLELAQMVISQSSIRTVFHLRQTSRMTRLAVDTHPGYQALMAAGPDFLCALLRSFAAMYVTLDDCAAALRSPRCRHCSHFGTYLCLLRWERCCAACLFAPPGPPPSVAWTLPGHPWPGRARPLIRPGEGPASPILRGVHGTYGTIATVTTTPAGPPPALRGIWRLQATRSLGYFARQWVLDPSTVALLTAIALPRVDMRADRRVERGVSCAGCERLYIDTGRRFDPLVVALRDQVYSREGFLEHVRWCRGARQLWEESGGGVREPAGLEHLAYRFPDDFEPEYLYD